MARVLVADDDVSVCELMAQALKLDDHAVESVTSESEAVLMYASIAPEVMVLDVNMPTGGAAAILKRIDANEPGVQCPVIVVTGDASLAATHPRIVEVIQKPFAINTLRQAVSSALSLP